MPDTPETDIGVSTPSTGTKGELNRMLESYKGRTSLIQAPQRQKAIYTIDRFDGGLNLNKAPRDLADWEACQMDCMSPARVGRLTRLGDFASKVAASSGNGIDSFMVGDLAVTENYGLYYFKFSNQQDVPAAGSPADYVAISESDGDIHVCDLSDDAIKANVVASFASGAKPVYHHALNRLYVSDANLKSIVDGDVPTAAEKSRVCGIIDSPKLYPYTSGTSVSYNITSNTANTFFTDKELYHAAPVKGLASGEIMVVGTQSGSTQVSAISNAAGTSHGIYMNINFEDIAGESSGIGWGGDIASGVKDYKFFASFIYDDGSESKLTGVSGATNADDEVVDKVRATTTDAGVYQEMIIKQVIIDATEFHTTFPRVHGVRFYYSETDSNGNLKGDDKYLFAELDFRYGFKLMSEFGNWNKFLQITGSDGGSIDAASIQVENAFSTDSNADEGDGTLSLPNPPTAFTYYALNLFHQEELKDDLMWKTSTMGNGIAFIGNVKYDNKEYPTTMIYSGAGETDAGSAYPMWGTFPVDSNRIDIPGDGGEITALKWTKGKVLQFRKNSLYIVNVENVLAPSVEGVYQGMGVHGPYAVTETSYGVAWVNDTGVYSYNAEEGRARSLTIGRIDTEDFQANSPHANTKIGYDDRAKMLIVTNSTKYDTAGYHYAYSFITDAWCTWNGNKAHAAYVETNFAIDQDGYLTGATDDGTRLDVYKWSVTPGTTPTIDYITKDIDFGKPGLDKRLYTLYISYTGGDGQSALNVFFRVNGKEGTDLTNGWYQLETIQDYTDPYFTTAGSAWADSSGTPATGDPTVNIDTGLNSTSTGEVQKLAKINLRNLGTTDTVDDTDTSVSTFPKDYLKFARSIQFQFKGTADENFEINDISLVYKEKRLK